jgi:opacity protein-like surface antigen
MKKIITALVLCGMMVLAQPSHGAFGGLRVGGMAGIGLLQGRHFYTGPNSPNDDMKRRFSVIGSMMGVNAGYLFELSESKLVVGGEVYLLIPGINPKVDLYLMNGGANGPVEGSVAIKHNRSIGFAATVGMMMNPKILVYLNVGIENARFQFTYLIQNKPPIPPQQVFNHSFKGLTPALGATYKMSAHMLVGAELSSPFFKRFKVPSSGSRTYHYKPAERRLVLKLSYLF